MQATTLHPGRRLLASGLLLALVGVLAGCPLDDKDPVAGDDDDGAPMVDANSPDSIAAQPADSDPIEPGDGLQAAMEAAFGPADAEPVEVAEGDGYADFSAAARP